MIVKCIYFWLERRIQELFPMKNGQPLLRDKRSTWMEDKHGGGIDFPSAESALLTISFLTFAVFLIKLVLVSNSH